MLPGLYNRIGGIALFLSAHAHVTGSSSSTQLALAAVAHLRHKLQATMPGRSRARPSSNDRAMRARRSKCVFAHLRVQHGFERMRLRGLTGARDEFHLAAIVQNLKTTALRLARSPTGRVCGSIA
jgi:hypothetical protein